jgi:hypothetical protein
MTPTCLRSSVKRTRIKRIPDFRWTASGRPARRGGQPGPQNAPTAVCILEARSLRNSLLTMIDYPRVQPYRERYKPSRSEPEDQQGTETQRQPLEGAMPRAAAGPIIAAALKAAGLVRS